MVHAGSHVSVLMGCSNGILTVTIWCIPPMLACLEWLYRKTTCFAVLVHQALCLWYTTSANELCEGMPSWMGDQKPPAVMWLAQSLHHHPECPSHLGMVISLTGMLFMANYYATTAITMYTFNYLLITL